MTFSSPPSVNRLIIEQMFVISSRWSQISSGSVIQGSQCRGKGSRTRNTQSPANHLIRPQAGWRSRSVKEEMRPSTKTFSVTDDMRRRLSEKWMKALKTERWTKKRLVGFKSAERAAPHSETLTLTCWKRRRRSRGEWQRYWKRWGH